MCLSSSDISRHRLTRVPTVLTTWAAACPTVVLDFLEATVKFGHRPLRTDRGVEYKRVAPWYTSATLQLLEVAGELQALAGTDVAKSLNLRPIDPVALDRLNRPPHP